jgi:hypothetical protein
MAQAFLQQIEWSRPWLRPLVSIAEPIVQASDWRAAANLAATRAQIHNANGFPIEFVPQASLPSGVAYESFIYDTGQVPTRENLHDFFNALIWLAYPAVKQRLNSLQAAELARSSAESSVQTRLTGRGKLRDAATIFDENAAFFVCGNSSMTAALRSHAWEDLFLVQRDLFARQCEVVLFGHSLIEKLVAPFKGITAHACCVPVDPSYFLMTPLDRCKVIEIWASKSIGHGLDRSTFTALPIAGIPGWWEGQTPGFYADISVFRPKRRDA